MSLWEDIGVQKTDFFNFSDLHPLFVTTKSIIYCIGRTSLTSEVDISMSWFSLDCYLFSLFIFYCLSRKIDLLTAGCQLSQFFLKTHFHAQIHGLTKPAPLLSHHYFLSHCLGTLNQTGWWSMLSNLIMDTCESVLCRLLYIYHHLFCWSSQPCWACSPLSCITWKMYDQTKAVRIPYLVAGKLR